MSAARDLALKKGEIGRNCSHILVTRVRSAMVGGASRNSAIEVLDTAWVVGTPQQLHADILALVPSPCVHDKSLRMRDDSVCTVLSGYHARALAAICRSSASCVQLYIHACDMYDMLRHACDIMLVPICGRPALTYLSCHTVPPDAHAELLSWRVSCYCCCVA